MPIQNIERQLRTHLLAERPAIFTLDALRQTFPDHPSVSIQAALKRLLQRGDAARVSRGRYTAVDPATGAPAAHEWAQALAPFRQAAIAGYSALAHWALTTQIPQVIDVAVRQGVHHQPSYGIVQRVRIITVPTQEWFGITHVWLSDGERVPIFSRARMVFDAFINPARYGGLGNAMEILETARDMDVPLRELVDLASQSSSTRARRRFAAALRETYGPEPTVRGLVANSQPQASHA